MFKFVLLPLSCETDAVVDFAHLVQGAGGVFGHEEHPRVIFHNHDGATARNTFSRIVSAVFHQLLWGNIKRHAHEWSPRWCSACTWRWSKISRTRTPTCWSEISS